MEYNAHSIGRPRNCQYFDNSIISAASGTILALYKEDT